MEPKKKCSKSKFTKKDDEALIAIVNASLSQNTNLDWNHIAHLMGSRNARQCRERWFHYLDPQVSKEKWSPEEDDLLRKKYLEIGPKWNQIATYFKHRPANSIRNRYLFIMRHETKEKDTGVKSNDLEISDKKNESSESTNSVDLINKLFTNAMHIDLFDNSNPEYETLYMFE